MKKLTSILLVLALVLGLAVPAFADNQTSGQTELSYTYIPDEEPNDPVYTVTIDATLDLDLGINHMDFEVSDMEDCDGKSVVITFASTSVQGAVGRYETKLVAAGAMLWDPGVYYELYSAAGVKMAAANAVSDPGFVLAEFAEDGIATISINIPDESIIDGLVADTEYTGTLTFGIALQ